VLATFIQILTVWPISSLINLLYPGGGYRERRRGSVSPVPDGDQGRNSIDIKNNLVRSYAVTPKSRYYLLSYSLPNDKACTKFYIFSGIASESDNSSLNSTEDANNVFLTRRVASAASPNHVDRHETNTGSGYSNVISGSVTTVPIDGHSSDPDLASQVSKHCFFIN